MFDFDLSQETLIVLIATLGLLLLMIVVANRRLDERIGGLKHATAELEAKNFLAFERGLEVLRAQPVAVVMADPQHLPDFDACAEVVNYLARQEVADVDILDDNAQDAIHGHNDYSYVGAGTLLIIGTVSDVIELRAEMVDKEKVRSTPTLTNAPEDGKASQLELSLIAKAMIELVGFLGQWGVIEYLRGESPHTEESLDWEIDPYEEDLTQP